MVCHPERSEESRVHPHVCAIGTLRFALSDRESCLFSGLVQYVKERLQMGLFPFRIAKDIKKFPTQPGWIELGMIWGKWE